MVIALEWIAKNLSNIMVVITFCIFFIKPIRKNFLERVLKDKAERSGICALLRKEIISECKKAINQGFIYFYDRENLLDMFEQYKALGGNHGIENLVNQATALPTKMD